MPGSFNRHPPLIIHCAHFASMDTSKLDTTDKSVPTDFTCNPPEPIVWDNNKATVLGYLHEWNKFTKRNGHFQTLIADHAVLLSNGKMAIDSVSVKAVPPRPLASRAAE